MLAKYKKRILELADYIDAHVEVEHFDMGAWFIDHNTGMIPIIVEQVIRDGVITAAAVKKQYPDAMTLKEAAQSCGTAACIAGWCALAHPKAIDPRSSRILSSAGDYLGLDGTSANKLFVPAGLGHLEEDDMFRKEAEEVFSKGNAVRVLRELAATGKVATWWKLDLIQRWRLPWPETSPVPMRGSTER